MAAINHINVTLTEQLERAAIILGVLSAHSRWQYIEQLDVERLHLKPTILIVSDYRRLNRSIVVAKKLTLATFLSIISF